VLIKRRVKQMKKFLLTGSGVVLLLTIIVFGAFFSAPSPVQAKSRSFLGANSTTATDPYCEAYQKDLAHRLHTSVTTLEQAQQAAFTDMLNQMVKDGKLTQKQATAIEQRYKGHMACNYRHAPAIPFQRYVIHQFATQYRAYILNAVAPSLHLTSQQLDTQLKSGKSLSQIAAAQHVSQADLKTSVNDAIQSALTQAVKDGNLTQSQATYLSQYVKSNPEILNYIVNAKVPAKHAPTQTPTP
jgi:polyhydroxyalkanoate synthesis regulator phasin